jgi:hypothetical protein
MSEATPMVSKRPYPITYTATCHQPGLLETELPEGVGACDRIFFIAGVKQDDGSIGCVFSGLDSVTLEEPTNGTWFEAWALLAEWLEGKLEPGTGRQELCSEVKRIVQDAMQQAQEANQKNGSKERD